MPSRPSWEGFLTFNLISIPVKAYSATSAVAARSASTCCTPSAISRIRYKKVCPIHGEVTNDEIVSGYEYAKGQYVTVETEEREAQARGRQGDRHRYVRRPDAIDPIYFSGRTTISSRTAGAQKPYAVLMEAMSGARSLRHCAGRSLREGAGRHRAAVSDLYDMRSTFEQSQAARRVHGRNRRRRTFPAKRDVSPRHCSNPRRPRNWKSPLQGRLRRQTRRSSSRRQAARDRARAGESRGARRHQSDGRAAAEPDRAERQNRQTEPPRARRQLGRRRKTSQPRRRRKTA